MRANSRREEPLPSSLYTQEYFLSDCEGYHRFLQSGGQQLSARLGLILHLVNPQPRMRILDLGCGRGELVFNCAKYGAQAVGLDYSEKAMELVRGALRAQTKEVQACSTILMADAKTIPLANGTFDVVIMADLIEHLRLWESDKVIREAARILRPGGYLVAHTLPNRWYYDYGHRLQRFWKTLMGQRVPVDPRTGYEHLVHINEQSVVSLGKALGQEFDIVTWLEPPGRLRSTWRRFISVLDPCDLLFCNDLWAVGWKKEPDKGQGASKSVDALPRLSRLRRLGDGWYDYEFTSLPAFRWTRRVATTYLRAAPEATNLTVVATSMHPLASVLPQRLTIYIDGTKVGGHAFVDNEWHTIRFPIPEKKGGQVVKVTLQVDRTWVPRKVLGTPDDRRLGIAVQRIAIE